VGEHTTTPFGQPKKGENVTENAISKLTALKQEELQFSEELPSILWVDFQDELWDIVLHSDSVFPIRTWRGELYSGEIWYAFYGFKEAPIFEGETTELRQSKRRVRMRHDGRFRMKTKVDAVIFSFKDSTIAIENPFSSKPVPDWFWEQALNLPRFEMENSMLNWPTHDLNVEIDRMKRVIEAIDKLDLYRW